MLEPGSPEVTKDLGGVFIHQLADSLQFDDQLVFNEQVCKKVTEQRSILIVNGQQMLLPDIHS